MITPLLPFFANMRPPQILVQIPEDLEWRYRLTGPIFLSIAAICGGWWALRHRSMQTTSARSLLLTCTGSLAVSYTAFWIWSNRDGLWGSTGFGAQLADAMPWLWAEWSLVFFILAKWSVKVDAEAKQSPVWPDQLLCLIMGVGVAATFVLAPTRIDMWPPIVGTFWALALAIWGVAYGISRLLSAPQIK
jgi:hypothetical protein